MQFVISTDTEEFAGSTFECHTAVSRSVQDLVPCWICLCLLSHEALIPMEDFGMFLD